MKPKFFIGLILTMSGLAGCTWISEWIQREVIFHESQNSVHIFNSRFSFFDEGFEVVYEDVFNDQLLATSYNSSNHQNSTYNVMDISNVVGFHIIKGDKTNLLWASGYDDLETSDYYTYTRWETVYGTTVTFEPVNKTIPISATDIQSFKLDNDRVIILTKIRSTTAPKMDIIHPAAYFSLPQINLPA